VAVEILSALGLVLAVEGVIYALFPAAMQRMMTIAVAQSPSALRTVGLLLAIFGVGLLWVLRG
jgi:uncharacterized protein YjeT (DUF2065 family)